MKLLLDIFNTELSRISLDLEFTEVKWRQENYVV
jgi:hypothetical protein